MAHFAFFSVSHALADLAADTDDHLRRVKLYRSILAADPCDQRAHDGLIAALGALGAGSHMANAQLERQLQMAALGLGT